MVKLILKTGKVLYIPWILRINLNLNQRIRRMS